MIAYCVNIMHESTFNFLPFVSIAVAPNVSLSHSSSTIHFFLIFPVPTNLKSLRKQILVLCVFECVCIKKTGTFYFTYFFFKCYALFYFIFSYEYRISKREDMKNTILAVLARNYYTKKVFLCDFV